MAHLYYFFSLKLRQLAYFYTPATPSAGSPGGASGGPSGGACSGPPSAGGGILCSLCSSCFLTIIVLQPTYDYQVSGKSIQHTAETFFERINYAKCGYHVPEPTRLGKMPKPLQPWQPSRHRFWKDRLGNTGDLSCLEYATEPSPPRSADGSSARIHRLADPPQRDFGRPRWIVPFTRELREHRTTTRPQLSLTSLHWRFLHLWDFFLSCPVSPSVNGLLYQPVVTQSAVIVQQ